MDLTEKIKNSQSTKNYNHNRGYEIELDQHHNKFNINFIKLLLIKKKKREKLMAKKREEMESKELEACSFTPKINTDFPLDQPRNDRFENLSKLGTKHLQARKDKTKEEYEVEQNGKECTHKPNVSKETIDFSQVSLSFDQDSYHMYFDRVKKGRLEKKLREIIHSRGPLMTIEEIEKVENEKKKKEETKKKEASKDKVPISQDRSRSVEKTSASARSQKEKKAENETNMNLRAFSKKEEEAKEKEEKKEVIPLLIIDVNLRPGEKKKIYVFDGDTAEGLAEKFSKEHNLDIETRNKLKVLIQNHMSKLLMRIEEENQSINSEKSSSNIFP